MKLYQVGFLKHTMSLEGTTREELINAFLRSLGGPQNAFNFILDNLFFIEDDSVETSYENIQD